MTRLLAIKWVVTLGMVAADWYALRSAFEDTRPTIWTYTAPFPCPHCVRAEQEWDSTRYRLVKLPYAPAWPVQGWPVFHFSTVGESSKAVFGWRGREAFDAEYNRLQNAARGWR